MSLESCCDRLVITGVGPGLVFSTTFPPSLSSSTLYFTQSTLNVSLLTDRSVNAEGFALELYPYTGMKCAVLVARSFEAHYDTIDRAGPAVQPPLLLFSFWLKPPYMLPLENYICADEHVYQRENRTLSSGTFRFPESGFHYPNCFRKIWNISHEPAFAGRVRLLFMQCLILSNICISSLTV